jgi:low affinity Fe/Cu permease
MRELFRKFSQRASELVGSPGAFITACLLLIIWAVSGPIFHYSDTWQLVINTLTTVITFLMVFLIQNTQNRDAKALHLKIDEIIRSIQGARNKMVSIEDLSDEELDKLQTQFRRLSEHYEHISDHAEDIADVIEEKADEIREKGQKKNDADK